MNHMQFGLMCCEVSDTRFTTSLDTKSSICMTFQLYSDTSIFKIMKEKIYQIRYIMRIVHQKKRWHEYSITYHWGGPNMITTNFWAHSHYKPLGEWTPTFTDAKENGLNLCRYVRSSHLMIKSLIRCSKRIWQTWSPWSLAPFINLEKVEIQQVIKRLNSNYWLLANKILQWCSLKILLPINLQTLEDMPKIIFVEQVALVKNWHLFFWWFMKTCIQCNINQFLRWTKNIAIICSWNKWRKKNKQISIRANVQALDISINYEVFED